MIHSTEIFIKFFTGVRKRTLNYVRVVRGDQINWSPKEGEFTCSDIIRHIASGERMFVGVATQAYGSMRGTAEIKEAWMNSSRIWSRPTMRQ